MTRDPEAAERLARRLLWAFGDSPLAAEAAALIRAQAAEIARLTALDTPAPQPDADEREALVRVVEATGPIYSTVDAETIADALLADGWTRKQEEG